MKTRHLPRPTYSLSRLPLIRTPLPFSILSCTTAFRMCSSLSSNNNNNKGPSTTPRASSASRSPISSSQTSDYFSLLHVPRCIIPSDPHAWHQTLSRHYHEAQLQCHPDITFSASPEVEQEQQVGHESDVSPSTITHAVEQQQQQSQGDKSDTRRSSTHPVEQQQQQKETQQQQTQGDQSDASRSSIHLVEQPQQPQQQQQQPQTQQQQTQQQQQQTQGDQTNTSRSSTHPVEQQPQPQQQPPHRSMELNLAFHTLRTPSGRCRHLLALHGANPNPDTGGRPLPLPPAFLSRMLDANEAVEAAMRAVPVPEPTLRATVERVEREIAQYWARAQAAYAGGDFAALAQVAAEVVYLERVRQRVLDFLLQESLKTHTPG